jgi:hypothetical protein
MKVLPTFLKISTIAHELFSRKTAQDVDRIRDHFMVAYNEAQLCALVVVSMILRVFHILPDPPKGTRSVWMVAGLLMQFLQNLDWQTSRGGPNPLDDLVEQGLQKMGKG